MGGRSAASSACARRRLARGRLMRKGPTGDPGEGDDLTPELIAELRAAAALPDERINIEDVPETADWSGAVRGRFYRPVKRQVTLRLCGRPRVLQGHGAALPDCDQQGAAGRHAARATSPEGGYGERGYPDYLTGPQPRR